MNTTYTLATEWWFWYQPVTSPFNTNHTYRLDVCVIIISICVCVCVCVCSADISDSAVNLRADSASSAPPSDVMSDVDADNDDYEDDEF